MPGGGTAVRTGNGATNTSTYCYEVPDQHGTNGLELDSTAQNPTWRQFTPYGAPRGTTTTWTDNRGFLNAPTDTSTDLTIVGARQYDPTTGRFISLDPLFEATSPQELNGYSYAGDNPIGNSDPSGMSLAYVDAGSGYCDSSCQEGGGSTVSHNEVPSTGSSGTHSGSTNGHRTTRAHHPGRTIALGDLAGIGNALDKISDIGNPACWVDSGSCSYDPKETDKWAASHGADTDSDVYKAAKDTGNTFVFLGISGRFPEWDDEAPAFGCLDPNSFASQTRVLMADGRSKPISKIKNGDRVKSADPITGKNKGSREVTTTRINHDYDLIDVTVQGENGKPATLHTTFSHPFWDDTTHGWTLAGKLKPGDLLNTDASIHPRVLALHAAPGAANRWNLTIAQLHTYYVLAGTTPVLVHNACGIDVEGVLGELSSKRVTTGRIFDSSGNAIHGEIEAGGSSDLVEATDTYLRQYGAPINPRAARYPASQHVESQYAMWMRQNGVTDATVVMNNSEGVCGGMYGCQGAVGAILPEGSKMTVWYPGAKEPTVILGEAAAP